MYKKHSEAAWCLLFNELVYVSEWKNNSFDFTKKVWLSFIQVLVIPRIFVKGIIILVRGWGLFFMHDNNLFSGFNLSMEGEMSVSCMSTICAGLAYFELFWAFLDRFWVHLGLCGGWGPLVFFWLFRPVYTIETWVLWPAGHLASFIKML